MITWLSEIPIEKAITANEGERSTKNIELTVEIVAITLAELSLYDPSKISQIFPPVLDFNLMPAAL